MTYAELRKELEKLADEYEKSNQDILGLIVYRAESGAGRCSQCELSEWNGYIMEDIRDHYIELKLKLKNKNHR